MQPCGMPIVVPAGTVTPFENVKSFTTLRRTLTLELEVRNLATLEM